MILIFKGVIFFCIALVLNFLLLTLFSSSYFIIYFSTLFIALYILNRYYEYYSGVIFYSFLILIFIVINLEVYDEYCFEIFLYFDYVKENIYINSEIMYALVVLHLILLLNLKKFEKLWDIIDKKLFRI